MTLGRAMKVRVRTGMFNADKLEVVHEDILQATHALGSIRICRVTAHRISIRSKNRTARKIYGAQPQTVIPAWVSTLRYWSSVKKRHNGFPCSTVGSSDTFSKICYEGACTSVDVIKGTVSPPPPSPPPSPMPPPGRHKSESAPAAAFSESTTPESATTYASNFKGPQPRPQYCLKKERLTASKSRRGRCYNQRYRELFGGVHHHFRLSLADFNVIANCNAFMDGLSNYLGLQQEEMAMIFRSCFK